MRAQLLIRRGELEDAGLLVSELHDLTVATGEPQRIIPMACAYLPWAALAGRVDHLRDVALETIELVGARWASTLTTLPAIRALATTGETDLLAQWAEGARLGADAGRTTRVERPRRRRSARAARERHEVAIDQLTDAADRDRGLGYAFDSAAIELELASALDAAGESDRAATLRISSETFFASIGCVHSL